MLHQEPRFLHPRPKQAWYGTIRLIGVDSNSHSQCYFAVFCFLGIMFPGHPSLQVAVPGGIPCDSTWYDVGLFKTLFCEVTHYNLLSENGPAVAGKTPDSQDPECKAKQELAPGVLYRFRVAGVNSCGQGDFSPLVEFKTCQPGFPGAPSAVKITKV